MNRDKVEAELGKLGVWLCFAAFTAILCSVGLACTSEPSFCQIVSSLISSFIMDHK